MKKYVKIFATMAVSVALIFGSFVSCGNSSDGGTSESNGGDSASAGGPSTPSAKIVASSSWENGKSENGHRSVKLGKGKKYTYTYAFWAETSDDLIVEKYKWNLEGNNKTNGPKIVGGYNNVTEEKKDTSYIVHVEVAPNSAAIQNSTITLTLTVTCTLKDKGEKITLSDVIDIILEESDSD